MQANASGRLMDTVLFDTPENPHPDLDGTRHVSGHFSTRDGRRLRYAIFKSAHLRASHAPRGTIVLLHGRNEYIEKYFETIADLTAMGFWVATFDWRGQGASERLMKKRQRGFVRRFTDYEIDLEDFLETIVLPDTRLPFYLLAHSTGALVALAAAPRLANRIDRMILSAPFVALGGQRLGQPAVLSLTRLLSLAGLGRMPVGHIVHPRAFPDNPLTQDARRFERNNVLAALNPDLLPMAPTARWTYEALKTMVRVRRPEHLASIEVPTLILAAGADALVPVGEVERLASYFRAGRVIVIPHARHEIFQEVDRYRVQALAAIDAFFPETADQEQQTAGGS
jgi:lysophospholipase